MRHQPQFTRHPFFGEPTAWIKEALMREPQEFECGAQVIQAVQEDRDIKRLSFEPGVAEKQTGDEYGSDAVSVILNMNQGPEQRTQCYRPGCSQPGTKEPLKEKATEQGLLP